MVQTAVSTDGAGQRWLTDQSAIALDFTEGEDVTLLPGAQVGGLTTRCAQPGKVVHIQYSAEFGVIYVVAFGKLRQYAYVSAEWLEAVDPPAEFVTVTEMPLPMGAPVIAEALGIVGVISGRSTCDRQRWRVTWFNRHYWCVEHKWLARSQFEVITSGAAENAANALETLSA